MVTSNISRSAIILTLAIINFGTIFSQNSLDDLNVILKHNFESNTPGDYKLSEWEKDWSYPEWDNRQTELDISQDPNDQENSSKLLQVYYPANSLGPSEGGTNWWTGLNGKYDEMYVSYDIKFMPGFQYQKGGKLPSVKGGSVETLGDFERPDGYDGFAAGMMFKEDGRLVFYLYYPDSKVEEYGETFTWGTNDYPDNYFSPSVVDFGYAQGAASYAKPGVWHNVTYRTVLNSVNADGSANFDGLLEAYFDGKLVLQMTKLLFRRTATLGIDCFRMVTFFGGNTDIWRNPISEWLKIDNVLLYTYKEQMDVPRGRELSPSNRVIRYWRNFGEEPEVVTPPPTPEPTPEPTTNTTPTINAQDFLVKENSFSNNYVGKISALDADAGQTLVYTITSGNLSGIFKLDSKTGALTTTTSKLFNFSVTEYDLVIKVTDNGTPAKSASASVNVKFIAHNTVIHIDPKNTADAKEDGTISHPFNSWSDITWTNGNTYLQKKGTTANVTGIVIGANNVTLDSYGEGEPPVITGNTNDYLISGFEKSNVSIQNLHLKALNAVSCIYFLGSTCANINIEHCILEGNDYSFRAMDCQSVILKYNTISSQNEGIYSSASQNEIYYNIFKNNVNSVDIVGSNSKANIFNNLFVNNIIAISASYAELKLYNNIFYLADGAQKAINHNAVKINSDNNLFYPEQEGFVKIAGKNYNTLEQIRQQIKLEKNSLNSDPLFVNMNNDNFSLEEYSPAINAGVNLNLDNDFFGQNVPVAGLPDIGIAEYTGNGSKQKASEEPKLVLYPNPSTGYVNIDADLTHAGIEPTDISLKSSTDKPLEINVLDIYGKIIYSKLVESTAAMYHDNIDLTGKMNGLYFIIIKVAGTTITEKLTLNR